MAASDHLQLKLFYGGKELRDSIVSAGDKRGHETMSDMWARKSQESRVPSDDENLSSPHGAGVYQSLKEHGWKGDPLVVSGADGDNELEWDDDGQLHLWDAHHRVAAAADIEETTGKPVWIPVRYDDVSQ